MYKIGERVCILNRNNKNGKITSVAEYGGKIHYVIMLDTGHTTTCTSDQIRRELIKPDPFQLLEQANFQSKSVYAVTSVINKMFGNNNNVIASLRSSRTEFLPYQFKPLIKFIKSDNRRLLVADEVGLGKTIEAGYILTELSLRRQINNCLIICPSTIKEKWREDLESKFGFNFKIYGRKQLQDAIIEDCDNDTKSVLGIISYRFPEQSSEQLLSLLDTNNYTFDLIIIDEAHDLRNSSTVIHKAVKRLIDISKNTLLLTATPVMTSITNLYSLVKLIEPKYDDYFYANQDYGFSLFMDHLELSRPFIGAINQLNAGGDPKAITQELVNKEIHLKISKLDGESSFINSTTVGERFKEDPLFNSVLEISKKDNLTFEDYALFQKQLSELNSFTDILSRTRRKEVQTELKSVTRRAEKCTVHFSESEADLYNSIIEDFEGEPLALVSQKRQATSCLPAYVEKNNLYDSIEGDIKKIDSKYKVFIKIVKKITIENAKKVIVFAFHKNTLRYLEERLMEEGIQAIRIDGDVKVEERHPTIKKFKNEKQIKVLLLSEVGNKGIDLQFCDALINYDLPWNPMIVEQRIGRIDRIGQKSEIIHIYNLCISGTIEDQIYERLLNRIKIFTESIGALEDILNSEIRMFDKQDTLESQIYGYKLSEYAIEQKIKSAEIALENAELIRKQIDADLKDSLIAEQYISDQLRRINLHKRYITQDDIKELLTLLFRTRLAVLRCDLDSPSPYIRWDSGDDSLFVFIQENLPSRKETPALYKANIELKKRFLSKNRLDFTFDQEVATEDSGIEFISGTHILTQAAFNYFKRDDIIKNNAFYFTINSKYLPQGLKRDVVYILAIFKLATSKYNSERDSPDISSSELQMLFAMDESSTVSILSEDDLLSVLSINFDHWETNGNYVPTEEECLELSKVIKPSIIGEFHSKRAVIEKEQEIIYKSKQNRLIDAEIDYLKRQIEYNQDFIKREPRNQIVSIFQSKINKHETRINDLLSRKKLIKIELDDTLQSISIIQII